MPTGGTPSTTLQQITGTTTSSPSVETTGSDGKQQGMYALWTAQTGSTATVTLTAGNTTGTPWLAGIEVVAAPISIPGLVTVTGNSTINLGSYQTAPVLAGGLTVNGGVTLSLTNPGAGNGGNIQVPGTLLFAGAGGGLNFGSTSSLTTATINDGGNGFSTAGAGTLVLTTPDNSATLTGAVGIGSLVQGSTGNGTTGSALGPNTLTVQSGGNIFGTLALNNSTITINSGGTIGGTATTASNSLSLNTNTIINNGTIAGGAGGTLRVGNPGATITVNGGGAASKQASLAQSTWLAIRPLAAAPQARCF